MSRIRYVWRCSKCHGAEHDGSERLRDCPDCGTPDAWGPMNANVAPDIGSARQHVPVFGDSYMDGVRAPDKAGTDIGSRTKRREYFRRHGLADADDYKETWAKAEAARAAVKGLASTDRNRREVVADVRDSIERIRAGKGVKPLSQQEWDKP